MKKFFLNAMLFAALASSVSLTSCSDDDEPNGENPGGGEEPVETVELSGNVEGTMTLDANTEYILSGTLTVPDGATLEIPAGTKIKARQGFGNYIIVAQGGKINARGTAQAPIIFTAEDESNAGPGYWGGLIINGKAPISGSAGSTATGATEVDNNMPYGGSDAADNSGTLEYIELWYTGARSSADIEHNGLTLNGVGNGTTINNVYIAEGADDAIEFFGGTVNVSNLLAVNCDDDMFDFTQGYSGTLSNCYGIWEEGFTSTEEDPRGIEADGNLDGNGADHTPQSDFKVENMTIANFSASQAMQDAIKVRRGATAHITNALVMGTGAVENLIDLNDGKGGAGEGTEMSVTNQLESATTDGDLNAEGTYEGVVIEAGNTGANTSALAWTGYQFPGETEAPEPAKATLSGDIASDMTLDANTEYTLEGAVVVKEGATLTIPAGLTIKAKEGFGNYLLVERGGKIMAEGTAEAPITFTAEDEANAGPGYWGGLIINGYARISGVEGTVTEGATEIDNNQPYGGDDNADNSGVLRYVKLLYTGARSNADVEHNGLTLNAVGNGTVIENIYIADGADDAIEFFGGSVNVTGLLAVNCDDDMFDFTQGYCGTLKDCYGRWEAGFTSTEEDPRGVEADGNLDGNGADHAPQSDFTIENMTIENLSEAAEMVDAIKIRRGAKATITNALVIGTGTVDDLVDLTDSKGDAQATTVISVTNELTSTLTGDEIHGTGEVTVADGNTGASAADFDWTGYQF